MRTLFEGWAMRHLLSLLMNDRGEYAAETTETAWRAWQAAWEHGVHTVLATIEDSED